MENNVTASNGKRTPPREFASVGLAAAGPRIPRSVNLHLTALCNYGCEFCYQTLDGLRISLRPGGPRPLDRDAWLRLQALLAKAGVERITYAGGEPTLFPGLDDLVLNWHQLRGGGTPSACVVTNGTRLDEARVQLLKPALLCVKLSAESYSEDTERLLGRGHGYHVAQTIARAQMLHRRGVSVDLNSVVCRPNLNEDLTPLVQAVDPRYWKVFQFLPVPGQNDAWIDKLRISKEEFQGFLQRHAALSDVLVPEDNDLMQESYAMVDPAGRFYQSGINGCMRSVHSILEVGVEQAFREVPIAWAKYDRRGGDRRAFSGRSVA